MWYTSPETNILLYVNYISIKKIKNTFFLKVGLGFQVVKKEAPHCPQLIPFSL